VSKVFNVSLILGIASAGLSKPAYNTKHVDQLVPTQFQLSASFWSNKEFQWVGISLTLFCLYIGLWCEGGNFSAMDYVD